jgi:hypothetical protein
MKYFILTGSYMRGVLLYARCMHQTFFFYFTLVFIDIFKVVC